MTDPFTIATSIALGIGAGLLYGLLWFAAKHQKNGEELNHRKLLGTLILSGAIGAGLAATGQPVTQETVVEAIAANLAALTLLEAMLKPLFRKGGIFYNYAS